VERYPKQDEIYGNTQSYSQRSIQPKQDEHGFSKPRANFTHPILADIDQYGSEGDNGGRRKERFGGMSERVLERCRIVEKAKTDSNPYQDIEDKVENEEHVSNYLKTLETIGCWYGCDHISDSFIVLVVVVIRCQSCSVPPVAIVKVK
jgi:hypothetical protein